MDIGPLPHTYTEVTAGSTHSAWEMMECEVFNFVYFADFYFECKLLLFWSLFYDFIVLLPCVLLLLFYYLVFYYFIVLISSYVFYKQILDHQSIFFFVPSLFHSFYPYPLV